MRVIICIILAIVITLFIGVMDSNPMTHKYYSMYDNEDPTVIVGTVVEMMVVDIDTFITLCSYPGQYWQTTAVRSTVDYRLLLIGTVVYVNVVSTKDGSVIGLEIIEVK